MLVWLHGKNRAVHVCFTAHISYLMWAGDFKFTFTTNIIYYIFSKKKEETKSTVSGNLDKFSINHTGNIIAKRVIKEEISLIKCYT